MSERELIVEATLLSKVYGEGPTAVRAIDDVSLEVVRGELVLIMGPSGSGKTTLLSMLGGLLRPTSGHVRIDGIEITALQEAQLPRSGRARSGSSFRVSISLKR